VTTTSGSSLRILILNWKDSAHPLAGGAETYTEHVAQGLVLRGHEVTLFVSAVRGHPGREEVGGVEIVRAGGRIGVYRAARRFWSEQPASFDVVIDEINTRPFMTPRWIRGAPVVALIHQLAREIWFSEMPYPIAALGRYILEPWWLRAYRRVPALTVSRSSADSLRRYHRWEDVTVVPEGWTPHPVPRVPKELTPTIVFLGRMVAMKRPEHALKAFAMLQAEFPNAQLWMMGSGPLYERLRASVPSHVSFLGQVPREEVLDRLARAHVLVTTSIREGWGLNVSEAAACGTPTIGYSVPGLVDSITESGGLLVDPNPTALGRALVDFFSGGSQLRPVNSMVPWSEVAAIVEQQLVRAVDGYRNGG
jgi:glycosyltransferase involved in cell wall biosynthesis